MAPPPRSPIARNASRAKKNEPRALTAITASHVRRPVDARAGGDLPDGGADMAALGSECMDLLREVMDGCLAAGLATSTDPAADTVALWLGLHGLAHQRAGTVAFPWPPDIAQRLITTLAHLDHA
ncbi:TetR-like C-terminal domain-containing protein [Nonomuraea sp. NPDC050404]|uniref:TetR-like C-terminal domain-containing protein n=1 Tax=Nonomuraea sp. NPDC050404 TaxID=3155783 RepID=UPI0033BFDE11